MTAIPHWMQYYIFCLCRNVCFGWKENWGQQKIIRQPTLFWYLLLILAYFFHIFFSRFLAVIVLYYFLPFNRHHIPALVCQRDGSWVIHQRDTAQQNNPWVYCILIRAKKRDSIEAPLTYTVKVVLSYYYYQEAESRGKSLWNCSCQNAEKQ